jgi:rifampicin phosphotransferase
MPVEIRDLTTVDPEAVTAFGGKACGLARLIAAGARVPPGLVASATTLPPDQWSAPERAELRQAVEALLAAGGAVAVRSSAVGEDSAERSFAGLFETFLGRRLPDEVEESVRACIASGCAPRVLEYAAADGPLPVAVVVQRQVDARAAGVCFTRDPSGQDGAVVIEAVPGTGDRLVSGQAAPERWRAYASGLGGWECRCEGAPAVLDAATVASIAAEAAGLATAFERPLDLEWALAEDGLWWLQARPITALREPPRWDIEPGAAGADDGPVTVWSNWNVRETMPSPLSPLTWTVWRDAVLPTVAQHLFGADKGSEDAQLLSGADLVAGRLYLNVNAMLAPPLFGRFVLSVIGVMDSRAAASLQLLHAKGVLRPRRLTGHRLSRLARAGVASLRGLVRLRLALRPRRALAILETDAASIRRRAPLESLADTALAEELRLIASPECERLLYGLQMEGVAIAVFSAARRAFARHERAFQLLGTGIPANPTTRISLGVDTLVELARPLSTLLADSLTAKETLARLATVPEGRAFLAGLERFLDEFGHRGPAEFDLGAVRWGEDPGMILDLVRLGLASTAHDTMQRRMAALTAERTAVLTEALAAEPWWRRPLLRRLARLVELYMPLREAPKHYGLFVFQRMRQAALELGRRLVERGALASAEDAFLLELHELEQLANGGPAPDGLARTLALRRDSHERHATEHPPEILRSDGVPVEAVGPATAAAPGTLVGTPVSAGRATGPVRVLASPDARLVSAGDVLVMEFADPGWTPLFPRAAAVVMEVGGLMCHAAVVAREMGVPAVFGVAGATRLLADGQQVVVDGGAGTVRPLNGAAHRLE